MKISDTIPYIIVLKTRNSTILILSTRMTEAYGSNGMKGIIFPPYSLLIPSLCSPTSGMYQTRSTSEASSRSQRANRSVPRVFTHYATRIGP